jgi:hypothetical protein
MEALHDPSLEGFQPVSTYAVRGIGYMSLEHVGGVKMELSQHGITEVDRSPSTTSLLERMGDYIERHDGYVDPSGAESDETVERFIVGSLNPQANPNTGAEEIHLSSVYHPNSAPEVIIKAYDHQPGLASTQFYFGAWLHEGMRDASAATYFPRQIALFTAPESGHRTAVMEYIPGISTEDLRTELRDTGFDEEIDGYVKALAERVRDDVIQALGHNALGIVDDINMPNTNNIIIDDSMGPIDLGRVGDRRLSVIDQPKVTSPMTKGRFAIERKVSGRRWREAKASRPAQQHERATV